MIDASYIRDGANGILACAQAGGGLGLNRLGYPNSFLPAAQGYLGLRLKQVAIGENQLCSRA